MQKQKKFSKDIQNIIRTTMRNSIELTHIADNKANVLLSLNALMLTFLIPLTIPYFNIIEEYRLVIPLTILVTTCLVTIYMAALVLRPSKFSRNDHALKEEFQVSPFFFGNFYKMNRQDFTLYMESAVARKEKVNGHLADDLHFIGSTLGKKMELIRIAFSVFLTGIFLSIIGSAFCIYLFHG